MKSYDVSSYFLQSFFMSDIEMNEKELIIQKQNFVLKKSMNSITLQTVLH